MKHLSSLVIFFSLITSFNLNHAQTVVTNDATYQGACDGTANFSDYANFSTNWTWNWYYNSTLIASGTNSLSNLCTGNYSLVLDSMGTQLTENFTISDPCSGFTAAANVTNCTSGNCDGIIQVVPSGGTAPYTFTFGGAPASGVSTISNNCPGTINIICTDNLGCSYSLAATVIDPSAGPIIPNLTTINAFGGCNGYAAVSPTGGSGFYTYLWNTGATSSDLTMLCAGSYTVTIYDGIDSVTVNAYIFDDCSGFMGSVTTTQASGPGICDGTATFMAYGGTAPYSYSWSNGGNTPTVTNLCNGAFTVYCTDAMGCIATTPVIVSNNPCYSFSGTFASTPTSGPAVCDGSITFNPSSGTAPFTFVWNTGSTTQSNSNLCAGTYSVTCTDANGCSTSGTGTITDSLCVISTYGALVNNCSPNVCDGSIDFSANSGATSYTYTWSNGTTTALISNLCPGIYTVYCEDANGCSISASYSITENVVSSPLTANLNSVDDYASNCTGSAFVSPSGGTAPYSITWSTGETSTFIDSLCPGIYSVTILDAANDSTSIDFIITDSSTTYGNNPYPNTTPSDTLYNYLVTNCVIDYSSIDSASLYQAVYDSINQNLYVTWAIYTPTDTIYLYDTLGFAGNPGYYNLTISVYCPNKSGNDFFKIEQVIYFDGATAYFSTLGLTENPLNQVSIYPNPFTHFISVDNKDGLVESLKLMDLNGRTITEMKNLPSGPVELTDLENIAAGTYLLVLSGEHSSKTYKVTK